MDMLHETTQFFLHFGFICVRVTVPSYLSTYAVVGVARAAKTAQGLSRPQFPTLFRAYLSSVVLVLHGSFGVRGSMVEIGSWFPGT